MPVIKNTKESMNGLETIFRCGFICKCKTEPLNETVSACFHFNGRRFPCCCHFVERLDRTSGNQIHDQDYQNQELVEGVSNEVT